MSRHDHEAVTIAWAEGNRTKQISFQSLVKYSNSDLTSLYSAHYNLDYKNEAGSRPTCAGPHQPKENTKMHKINGNQHSKCKSVITKQPRKICTQFVY